jgi:hypothetical protein
MVPPRPGRVARFITTEAAESTLRLAEDGKLPELHLREPGEAPAKEASGRGMNPLVLFGLLSLSLVASVALLLMPAESNAPSKTRERMEAREVLQGEYYAEMDKTAHYPYQVLLREAQRAHSRRDWKQERALYRKVLDLLRAEPHTPEKNLTGSPRRDEKLERQLTILLSD